MTRRLFTDPAMPHLFLTQRLPPSALNVDGYPFGCFLSCVCWPEADHVYCVLLRNAKRESS